jgi:hypothetical protein
VKNVLARLAMATTALAAIIIALSAQSIGAQPAAQPSAAKAHGGFVEDMDCAACHTPEAWSLAQTAGQSGFDHDRTGFPLRSAHQQATCAGCHVGTAKPATTCVGCHRDSHQSQLGNACEECHRTTTWKDTRALEKHRTTRMPLTGKHAITECVACHTRGTERTFSAVPSDCYSCHRKAYHNANVHPDHDGDPADPSKPPFPRDCSLCHRTIGWLPAVTNPNTLGNSLTARLRRVGAASVMQTTQLQSEHDGFFVISTGAHRDAACDGCHIDPRRPRAVRCDGCHTAASVTSQHKQPVSRAANACLRCHPRGARR